MNENDAIEQAYKNGYEAGVKEFAERVKNGFCPGCEYETFTIREFIDTLVKELTERKEDGK